MENDDNLRKFAGEKIRNFRESRNMTQDELAEALGTTRQAVSRYENGDRGVNQFLLFQLSKIFNKSIDDFFPNNDNISTLNFDNATAIDIDKDTVKIPVLGRIPAGMPMEAIEETYTIDYEEIPREWLKSGNEFFALKLKGDSMEPNYHDSDIVIFQKACDCENGQDCCVRINGFDATFKRVKKQGNGVNIIPLNENNSTGFEATFYTNEEVISKPVEIVGVVKQIRRNL